MSLLKNYGKKFQLQDIGQLHDVYMNTDVMLLADVFESFRNKAMEKHKLDPAHFMTSPSLRMNLQTI